VSDDCLLYNTQAFLDLGLAFVGGEDVGPGYHNPEHEADRREAGHGRMTIDEVVRRGVERIRAGG
jgi:hypothetical protein